MGDSGESRDGSSPLGGAIPFANCSLSGGDEERAGRGCSSAIDDCTSDIRSSNLWISEGLRSGRPGPAESGGLERELALLS